MSALIMQKVLFLLAAATLVIALWLWLRESRPRRARGSRSGPPSLWGPQAGRWRRW
jgi:hypothetical protein